MYLYHVGEANKIKKIKKIKKNKLRRHKQRFGNIATIVVLDKDENLFMIRVATTSDLSSQRNGFATYFT